MQLFSIICTKMELESLLEDQVKKERVFNVAEDKKVTVNHNIMSALRMFINKLDNLNNFASVCPYYE